MRASAGKTSGCRARTDSMNGRPDCCAGSLRRAVSRGGAGRGVASTPLRSSIDTAASRVTAAAVRSNRARAREGLMPEKPTLENGNDLRRRAHAHRQDVTRPSRCFAIYGERSFRERARRPRTWAPRSNSRVKNEEALQWIRESVLRDPERACWAPNGSTCAFSSAKLALAKDPEWLEKNSVLSLTIRRRRRAVAPEILPVEKGKLKGAEDRCARSTINSWSARNSSSRRTRSSAISTHLRATSRSRRA